MHPGHHDVPWEATIIANYLTVSGWGWLDTFSVLILPSRVLRYGRVPDAAELPDLRQGAPRGGKNRRLQQLAILATIVVRPVPARVGALGAYVFLQQWNQYLWPPLVTNSDKVRTVQIGVSQMYDIDSSPSP